MYNLLTYHIIIIADNNHWKIKSTNFINICIKKSAWIS